MGKGTGKGVSQGAGPSVLGKETQKESVGLSMSYLWIGGPLERRRFLRELEIHILDKLS